jgi:manganese/iron transport system substrate-binding protein
MRTIFILDFTSFWAILSRKFSMIYFVRQSWKWGALALLVGVLTSCTAPPPDPTQTHASTNSTATVTEVKRPKVVATSTVLCDIARAIAGDTIDLTCLLKPGVDGHLYEAVPQDRRAIEDAQLILYSGYNFESNLIKLIQSTSNPAPKVAVAERAVTKPLMGEEHHHGEATSEVANQDHSHGKEEEQVPDPHVWHNPCSRG